MFYIRHLGLKEVKELARGQWGLKSWFGDPDSFFLYTETKKVEICTSILLGAYSVLNTSESIF